LRMNERALLEHIMESTCETPGVVIGPGDDMALLDVPGGSGSAGLLISVDQVVDGVHVRADTTPWSAIGRKAVARALSDVAAMAGRPLASIVAAVLPPGTSGEQAAELFDAMRLAAEQYRAPIIGGDLAFHHAETGPLTCSVTVLATPTTNGPVKRSGAMEGDAVCVTGVLGGSFEEGGAGRHLEFEPRIGEAIMLQAILKERLHSMIDLSDGLGTDGMQLLDKQAHLQIRIKASDIPCSEGVDWRRAVADGEDYELCFCAEGELPEQVLDCGVTRIGMVVKVEAGDARRIVVIDGEQEHDISGAGWEHCS
jgi:thiamine-monophosphate kinase